MVVIMEDKNKKIDTDSYSLYRCSETKKKEKWVITKHMAKRATRVFEKLQDAIDYAQEMTNTVYVHEKNGFVLFKLNNNKKITKPKRPERDIYREGYLLKPKPPSREQRELSITELLKLLLGKIF